MASSVAAGSEPHRSEVGLGARPAAMLLINADRLPSRISPHGGNFNETQLTGGAFLAQSCFSLAGGETLRKQLERKQTVAHAVKLLGLSDVCPLM